ncbi:MAG: polynucleotide kinase-phosphatase, partial [Verrucomicrobia bacterium]|nr:polynucleotide kinase-phosphatase [Cytophagales bacterium]
SFFSDEKLEQQFLEKLNIALEKSNFYEKHTSDWVCLDCELMPWSAKAQSLLQNQYAAVGSAAKNAIPAAVLMLEKAAKRFEESGLKDFETLSGLKEIFASKKQMIDEYIQAYQHYCWEVFDLADYTLAPFHILATENAVHTDKPHTWHLEQIADFCRFDEKFLLATPFRIVDLSNEESCKNTTDWWHQLTISGGEGMVVKPLDFITKNKKGLVQPAIKCRGKAYLQIIYGAEYYKPENLNRLKQRNVNKKRTLALQEFALGLEALHSFVKRFPLRKTHEYIFGILALESEPVDPRL